MSKNSRVIAAPEPQSSAKRDFIYGRNPVMEAISAGSSIDKILMQKNIEGAGKKIYALAKKAGIIVQSVDKQVLDRTAGTTSHQGVVAYVSEFKYSELSEILELAKLRDEPPFIVILDGIEDPHNLGAIIRSADGAGAHGVVIPKRRSASVNATVAKASAGAAAHMKVVRASNLVTVLDELKSSGVWSFGLDMDGSNYREHSQDYKEGVALVVGSEGNGLSRLVKENCDYILSIPMNGKVNSLNASNAAAIVMFEISGNRAAEAEIFCGSPSHPWTQSRKISLPPQREK
jgi:23S rRNA (guanosine2251-2'-O)-methyltransferase